MAFCNMKSLIRLLVKLILMLYYLLYGGEAAAGRSSSTVPTTVTVGTVFSADNVDPVMQSSNGLFWLKFRKWVDSDNINYCMAGVGYTKMQQSPGGVMWSFSQEPVLGLSCRLNLSNDGVLYFEHDGGVIAWQSKRAGSDALLTLTDEGNLVLQDQANQIIWHSFGEPSFFILPSCMKFNKSKTLFQRNYIAQSSFEFSIPGNYSAELSQSGDHLSLVITLAKNSLFVYQILAAPNVKDAQFVMLGDGGIDFYDNKGFLLDTIASELGIVSPEAGSLKLGVMTDGGNLNLFYWNKSQFLKYYTSSISQCDQPLRCGKYRLCNQLTGVCSCPRGFREDGMNCKGTDATQSLVPIPVVFHSQLSPLSVKSQGDCKTLCDRDHTCNAALFDSKSLSCALFPIVFTVMEGQNNSQLMFLKISPAPHNMAKVIGIAVGISVLVFLTCGGLVSFSRRRRRRSISSLDHDELYLQELPRLPQRYSYKDLQVATNDFSRKLGEGGFGSVYEGVLDSNNGRKLVAVKKLEQNGSKAWSMDQFKMEVATIGNVSHRNLVILKGFCMEEGARLLVYEFMARASLDRWLFERKGEEEGAETGGVQLDWERRCSIALDTAKGLEYLHHECAERIVHCDVKPENILLDEKFNAKVADFGLAKLIGADNESLVMSSLKGTRGYLAPEWLQDATITTKSDVFSYGVVLLELISGQRCVEAKRGYLPTWALNVVTSASTSSSGSADHVVVSIDTRHVEQVLLDERLRGDVPAKSLERMLLIALACVNADPSVRPSMASVVQMLDGLVDVVPFCVSVQALLPPTPLPLPTYSSTSY